MELEAEEVLRVSEDHYTTKMYTIAIMEFHAVIS